MLFYMSSLYCFLNVNKFQGCHDLSIISQICCHDYEIWIRLWADELENPQCWRSCCFVFLRPLLPILSEYGSVLIRENPPVSGTIVDNEFEACLSISFQRIFIQACIKSEKPKIRNTKR